MISDQFKIGSDKIENFKKQNAGATKLTKKCISFNIGEQNIKRISNFYKGKEWCIIKYLY